jgi:hypothetical protein
MLVFDEYLYGPHAAQWWAKFARMDRPSFEKQAAGLIRPQGILAVLPGYRGRHRDLLGGS